MSFTRVRAPGFWTADSTVLASEVEAFDARYTAIDGGAGGVYSPSAVIEIGGSGLKITSEVEVAAGAFIFFDNTGWAEWGNGGQALFDSGSELKIQNGAQLAVLTGGVLTVQQASSILLDHNAAVADSDATGAGPTQWTIKGAFAFVSGSTLDITDAAMTLHGAANLTFLGTGQTRWRNTTSILVDSGVSETHNNSAVFQGLTVHNGLLVDGGGASFSTTTTFTAAILLNSGCVVEPSGSGHIRQRAIVGADANHSYSIDDADYIYIASGLTGDHTYTIADGTDGDMMHFATADITHTITLSNSGPAAVVLKNASGAFKEATIAWITAAGGWTLMHSRAMPLLARIHVRLAHVGRTAGGMDANHPRQGAIRRHAATARAAVSASPGIGTRAPGKATPISFARLRAR